ncbi:MAG TPA: FHIPEP family type III secretion protein, partial [Trinickia sp.]|nr:FHIPEP family type III secretion protein [Trinickia sp.]
PLLDEPGASALLARIAALRRRMALEAGIVLPSVRVKDDERLPPRGFAIRVRDRVVTRGEVRPDRPLAIGPPAALSRLEGIGVADPVTGAPAKWLDLTEEWAMPRGAIVVDPIAVLTSSLGIAARKHAAALLGRQEVQQILDHVRKTQPAAVRGVVPELAGVGLVQRVLQHLAREGVSIRDIAAILETIADEVERTKDAAAIGEAARRRLAPSICASIADTQGRINAAVPSAECEDALGETIFAEEFGPALALDVDQAGALERRLQAIDASGATICCAQSIRLPLARFAESCGIHVPVVGFAEIAPGFSVHPVQTFDLEER